MKGHWREDHLFSLDQSLQMYDSIEQRAAAYDREILRQLQNMTPPERRDEEAPSLTNALKMKSIRKRKQEPVRHAVYRMSGVDMTKIEAVGVETVQVVLSEYGPDLSRFPTEKISSKRRLSEVISMPEPSVPAIVHSSSLPGIADGSHHPSTTPAARCGAVWQQS